MIHYVATKPYDGLDFWNDPFLWDGIEDTHKQMCWEPKPEKLLAVEPPVSILRDAREIEAMKAQAEAEMQRQQMNAQLNSYMNLRPGGIMQISNCQAYGNMSMGTGLMGLAALLGSR